MREEGEAVEHRHVARAEHDRDQRRRGRNGREPEQAGRGPEGERRDDAPRGLVAENAHRCRHERDREEKTEGHDRAGEIDDREDPALRHAVAEPARRQRTDDIEHADERQRPAANLGRHTDILEIARQMHGDEGELEAAGEEAEHQQHIGAMAKRLRERLHHALVVGGSRRTGSHLLLRRGRDRERQRQDQQREPGEDRQRALPAVIADESDAERRIEELAERTRRGAGAEGHRALFGRQQLAEGREHEVERRAGKAETDQHAAGDRQRRRVGRNRHQVEAGSIEQRAAPEHLERAETIGNRAHERLADAPHQVLDRQCEGEDIAAPAVGGDNRLLEKAHRRARAEAERRDGAAGEDDEAGGQNPGRIDAGNVLGGHAGLRVQGRAAGRLIVQSITVAHPCGEQIDVMDCPRNVDGWRRPSILPSSQLPRDFREIRDTRGDAALGG